MVNSTPVPRQCVRRVKTYPGPKNRVWGFRAKPSRTHRVSAPRSLQPRRENRTTATKTASGVRYYGYRYYDPVTGRWPSRDPIGERGGLNLYAFVGNDGVNLTDFLGQVRTIHKPGLVHGRKCDPCCKKCVKTGTPKIEDDGTKGTSVKAKITSVDFKSVYTTDKCSHERKCGDCCAVYYRWWTCYTDRCQKGNGGPSLGITVIPVVSTDPESGWRALNVSLKGYFWCSCENGKWNCKNEPALIIGPTYRLKMDNAGSYWDKGDNWYGWELPNEKGTNSHTE